MNSDTQYTIRKNERRDIALAPIGCAIFFGLIYVGLQVDIILVGF